jgi:List-Bact-rpt repeat protein
MEGTVSKHAQGVGDIRFMGAFPRVFPSLAAIVLVSSLLTATLPTAAQSVPFCDADQPATFADDFLPLVSQLGGVIGDPIECTHAGDNGTQQGTTNGVLSFRPDDGAPMFTSGSTHWVLQNDGVSQWTDPAPDPCLAYSPYDAPERACPVSGAVDTQGAVAASGGLNAYIFNTGSAGAIVTGTLTNLGTDYDMYLVQGSTNGIVAQSRNDGLTPEVINTVLNQPDTYFLYVYLDASQPTSDTPYDLKVSVQSFDPGGNALAAVAPSGVVPDQTTDPDQTADKPVPFVPPTPAAPVTAPPPAPLSAPAPVQGGQSFVPPTLDGGQAPPPPPLQQPTQTPVPTATPVPSQPTSTPTPMPTATATPTVTPTPAPSSFTLNVSSNGSGSVIGSGLTCSGSSCTGTYASGATASLAAIPGTGYGQPTWSGCDATTSTTCSVAMTSNKSIVANFPQLPCNLSVGAGGGTVSPSGGSYPCGTTLTLTGTADAGHSFSGWGGACSGSAPTCQVTLSSQNTTVTASFPAIRYTLSVAIVGNSLDWNAGGAGIQCPSTCSTTIEYGTSVDVISHYTTGPRTVAFRSWSGCDSVSAPLGNDCQVTIKGNRTITVTYDP